MAVRAPAAKVSREEAEERLLVAAAQKDPRRFAGIYELHFEQVYAYIARRVGSREIAEDLTSEVFHKALANLSRFEWRGVPFVGWLLRIASNAIVDQAKRSSKEITDLEDPEEIAEVGASDIAEAIHRSRLFGLVDKLPDDQRRVVTMRFAEEKSIREIADEIGRSEGAVKQLQFRGLQNLRAQFEKKPGGRNG
ncbi:MAG: sigma-70 family RNA polymerase sigma factor [Terriglobales bacterium]